MGLLRGWSRSMQVHWAKIEAPEDPVALAAVACQLQERFPVERFKSLRDRFDPKRILSSPMLDALLGK